MSLIQKDLKLIAEIIEQKVKNLATKEDLKTLASKQDLEYFRGVVDKIYEMMKLNYDSILTLVNRTNYMHKRIDINSERIFKNQVDIRIMRDDLGL